MIDVEHLTKRYGPRTAVSDVSFHVKRGEVVGFLGPNGAGKSTTLRVLTGFLEATSGRVRVEGIDASDDPVGIRKRIGYMPESAPLYPEMRVSEYLRFRAELKGVPRGEIAKNVARALEQAIITDVRARIIGQLSKGYKQRVGLADALVADPPVLVLDEPTAGLDPNQIRQVRDLIRSFAGSKTVLLSTHILPEVEASCERVVIIHKGRVVGEGKPGELRGRSTGTLAFTLLGRGDPARYVDIVRGVEGTRAVAKHDGGDPELARVTFEVSDPTTTEGVAAAVISAGLALRELRQESKSLEDVFTELTTHDASASADTARGSGVRGAPSSPEPSS